MHVKQEPTSEEARETSERAMDVSGLHPGSYHQHGLDPSRHSNAAGSVRSLSYSGYDPNFDQRLVNPLGSHYPMHPAYTTSPPPASEISRQEKLKKELSNYMLQNNIPSSTLLSQQMSPTVVSSPEAGRPEDYSDVNVLKMKQSNGKLAIPDITHTDGTKSMDIVQSLNTHQRAKREFVPDEKKDEGYWTKRVKNNDSARRSRVKRKALEKIMETRLTELQQENIELRHELNALKRRFGVSEDGASKSSSSASSSSYNYLKSSGALRPSSPPEKFTLSAAAKYDDLDHQSSASDDSRSLDDSRSAYNIRSASALSQSLLDPSRRDRADSFSSCSSANRSPTASSSPSFYPQHNFVRTDKTGALDLTSDFGPRAPPTSMYNEAPKDNSSINSPSAEPHSNSTMISFAAGDSKHSGVPAASDHGQFNEEKMDTNMRGFPLKCRWKLSSSSSTPCTKATGESNGSFPDV